MEFVSLEIAKKLKEKGFKEECLCHYIGKDLFYNIESPIANNQLWFCHNKYDNIWHRDNVDAPTISQVLKWLREEKKIHIQILFTCPPNKWEYITVKMANNELRGMYATFTSYEEAALAGIEYVLDNLI